MGFGPNFAVWVVKKAPSQGQPDNPVLYDVPDNKANMQGISSAALFIKVNQT